MRCDWKRLPEQKGGWPLFRCQRCKWAVEVRLPEPLEVLARQPDCGVVVARQRAKIASLVQARDKALAAGKPFPPLVKRIGSWRKAIARWVKAGKPCRSDDEVARIFDTICEPCEHFRADKQSCNLCGCKVRRSGKTFLNKIAMATESCPLGKWGGGDSEGN